MMKFTTAVLLLALLCNALGQMEEEETEGPKCTGDAMYEVTNMCQWTSMRHPKDYPPGASFSPLCGSTHNAEYTMFESGGMATDGVKYVAEEGDCSFLKDEVDTCVEDGYCADDEYFSWACDTSENEEGTGDGVCTHSGTINVTPEYPYVSMVSMAVPSPDWFVGVSNLNLCVEDDNGEYVWLAEYPADAPANLYAYDSGTDSGVTFMSENEVSDPIEPIIRLGAMDNSNIFYNEEEEMLYPLCQIKLVKV